MYKRSVFITEMEDNGDVKEQYEIANTGESWETFSSRYYGSEIALEVSTTGKYVARKLRDLGFSVHLADPSKLSLIFKTVKKNDKEDSYKLAKLLRLGELPEVHLPSRESEDLRSITRYRKSISDNTDPIMIAFDYTHEDFYGDRDSLWIHGWTGDHGVTGRFSYLTASIVNNDLRLPMVSIPSPMGNDMPSEISAILDLLLSLLGHIDLLLFDRGFYSKDLIMSLNDRKINYLIFVTKNPQVKDEFSSMYESEKKVILHEFSTYKNGRKVSDSFHLAFLKQIFDHRTEEYYDWCFATNSSDIDLDRIIAKYNFRWRIETMFRVQDECRIKTKSKDIRVRYFLFAYEQLV